MKKLSILFIVMSASIFLHAQTTPTKVTRQATKALVKQPAVQVGTLSRYNGIHGAVMGVDYYLQRNTVPQIHNAATQRSWLEQQKRNWKARQLHNQRRKRDEQYAQLEQQLQQLEALEKTLPQLTPAHTFETDEFSHLLVAQLPDEPLPLLERPGVLYRGMALPADGEAVKNILQNGLRLEDLGSHATTKLLAMSGGIRGLVSTRPVTNLTSLPQDALYWGTQRTEPGKELLVIAVVKNQTQSGKVVLYSDDIPAENIDYLIVPLHLGSKPLWYKVELTEDSPYGPFRLTPYEDTPDVP